MTEEPEPFVRLADVQALLIKELMNTDNPALKASLERLLHSLNDPSAVISAFSSFVE